MDRLPSNFNRDPSSFSRDASSGGGTLNRQPSHIDRTTSGNLLSKLKGLDAYPKINGVYVPTSGKLFEARVIVTLPHQP